MIFYIKKHKLLFAIFIVCLLATSCHTTYYYAQVESADPYMQKDYNRVFTINSDSLRVSYSFNGENAPITIGVFNKMNRSVIIDWESSWFLFGDDADNKINLSQYMNDYDKKFVVAPYSNRKTELFELSELHFDKLDKKLFSSENITLSDGNVKKMKTADFTEETTPLYMSSLLSLHLDSTLSPPLIYEQDFYISKLTKGGGTLPGRIAFSSQKQGDIFFTRKEHGKGFMKALEVGGQILLVTGVVAVEIISTVNEVE